MKLRFIVPWQTYVVGDQINPPATRGEWLIAQGYCKLVTEDARPEGKMEVAVTTGPEETACTRVIPPKRKRGRPRKIQPDASVV